MLSNRTVIIANALALLAISVVLCGAFIAQIALYELPCPLCNMQRAALLGLAAGPALNLCFGIRARHYALTILAAVLGAVISGRQVLLHIMPGDAGYGEVVLGIHLYTWCFIIFVIAIVATALVLFAGQKPEEGRQGELEREQKAPAWARAAIVPVILLAAFNVVSVVLECGGAVCPDNPVVYLLLGK